MDKETAGIEGEKVVELFHHSRMKTVKSSIVEDWGDYLGESLAGAWFEREKFALDHLRGIRKFNLVRNYSKRQPQINSSTSLAMPELIKLLLNWSRIIGVRP